MRFPKLIFPLLLLGSMALVTASRVQAPVHSEGGLQADAELLPGLFTVNEDGKTVRFTRGNLYWDGMGFRFEEHQYDYPTSWDEKHIGHFYWSKSKDVAIAADYDDKNISIGDTFFANSPLFNGLAILTRDEWNYLFSHAIESRESITSTIGGNNCIILAPDGFTGYIKGAYTPAEWADAEEQYSLVALPLAGLRDGTQLQFANSYGYYWTPDTHKQYPKYVYGVYSLDRGTIIRVSAHQAITSVRDLGYCVRMVAAR